jgi:signal transduction histidine kinase
MPNQTMAVQQLLTASIAHEVSQPLSGILINASTCLRLLSIDPPNIDGARETVRRAIRDVNRATDVITRLRGLFAKHEPVAESVNLNEAVLEVLASSRCELDCAQITVRCELADDLPPLLGDRIQLQQVVSNLVRNAMQAMHETHDRPRDLTISTWPHGPDQVRLSVHDVGVGIASGDTDKLFESFYTTKPDGLGMGLSISRSIVERHGGCIWATPNDGSGATFWLAIPSTPLASHASTFEVPSEHSDCTSPEPRLRTRGADHAHRVCS